MYMSVSPNRVLLQRLVSIIFSVQLVSHDSSIGSTSLSVSYDRIYVFPALLHHSGILEGLVYTLYVRWILGVRGVADGVVVGGGVCNLVATGGEATRQTYPKNTFMWVFLAKDKSDWSA